MPLFQIKFIPLRLSMSEMPVRIALLEKEGYIKHFNLIQFSKNRLNRLNKQYLMRVSAIIRFIVLIFCHCQINLM